jgi:hypothetical protein
MASGYLNRIESAFAEAALDSGWWGRAVKIAETGSFGVTILRLGGVVTPEALFPGWWVAWSARADVYAGLLVAPGAARSIARRSAKACHLTCVRRHRHAEKISRDESIRS